MPRQCRAWILYSQSGHFSRARIPNRVSGSLPPVCRLPETPNHPFSGSPKPTMNILISNDDGYQAEGLAILARVAAEFANVRVVAPERNRSGASNSLTLDRPLRIQEAANGFYFVDGTPTDCIHLALHSLPDFQPNWVFSGINHGANMGDDTLYSGTVAAARAVERQHPRRTGKPNPRHRHRAPGAAASSAKRGGRPQPARRECVLDWRGRRSARPRRRHRFRAKRSRHDYGYPAFRGSNRPRGFRQRGAILAGHHTMNAAHTSGSFDWRRRNMVQRLAKMGISRADVLAAMGNVPRHVFVEEALRSRAYDDMSLPLGLGQTISQPYTAAVMTQLMLGNETTENFGPVLEIGTGRPVQRHPRHRRARRSAAAPAATARRGRPHGDPAGRRRAAIPVAHRKNRPRLPRNLRARSPLCTAD